MIPRSLSAALEHDLDRKIVLLSGPRQVGKTTCARSLPLASEYLNFDLSEDRKIILQKRWRRDTELIIFDELHKLNKWKSFLKGVFDTEGSRPRLLVTGSARLDILRNVGDSLAGRYFHHRLYPFDLAEGTSDLDPDTALTRLLEFGGFPEPFLAADSEFYGRWRRTHLDTIIRQDLIDLERISDIPAMFILVDLLRERVGTPVSTATLAAALSRDPKTIKNWLVILEKLYVIFRVTPYSKRLKEVIRKEPKYYFFNVAEVPDPAARLENAVALSLLKELHRREDKSGHQTGLYYLRTRTKREIDFLVEIGAVPRLLVEVKETDEEPAPAFKTFGPAFPKALKIQLVRKLPREQSARLLDVEVRRLAPWMREISDKL